MATRTSSQAGDWTDTATWGGSAAPGSGDTAIINHTGVIADDDIDVDSVTVNGPASKSAGAQAGKLIVGAGNKLSVSGDVFISDGIISGEADAILELGDGAVLEHGDWFGQVNSLLSCEAGCTKASPFTIQTISGATTPAQINSLTFDTTKYALDGFKFLRLGSSTVSAAEIAYTSRVHSIVLKNGTIDTCGMIRWLDAAPDGAGWDIGGLTFVNSDPASIGGLAANLSVNGLADDSGARTITGCFFDKALIHSPYSGATYADNVILGGLGANVSSGVFDCAVSGNFMRVQASGTPIYDDFVDNIVLFSDGTAAVTTGVVDSAGNSAPTATLAVSGTPWGVNDYESNGNTHDFHVVITSGAGAGQVRNIYSNTSSALTVIGEWDTVPSNGDTFSIYDGVANAHFIQPAGDTEDILFDGNVLFLLGSDNNGDGFLHMDLAKTYTLTRNIVLPNLARDGSCTLVTLGGAFTGGEYIIEHNDAFVGGQAGVDISEGADNAADQITSFKSNKFWSRARIFPLTGSATLTAGAFSQYKISEVDRANDPSGGTQDIVTAGAGDYNADDGNLRAGFEGDGYNINCSTVPGANDISSDPGLVDPWRNPCTWAVTQGSVETDPHLQAADLYDYLAVDVSLVDDLLAYLRAGQVPTNEAYRDAGHDAVTIGAVEMGAPPATGIASRLLLLGVGA